MPDEVEQEEAHLPLAREGQHLPPTFGSEAFHCPYCGVLAPMLWEALRFWGGGRGIGGEQQDSSRAECGVCGKAQLWTMLDPEASPIMVRPVAAGGQRPHIDMPADVLVDYNEARAIVGLSPRGACALLRLATQKLVDDLVPGKARLDDKVGALVTNGLPEMVAQALDVLRVVGNNAVHPGELVIEDEPEIAVALFECINVIIEDRIARPARVNGLFAKLPKGALDAIERRNAQKQLSAPDAA